MRARLELRGAGGELRHLGIAVSILRGEGGEAGGYVVIFQDVTGVVQIEQELRRRERLAAVGELAAGVAHEIRNPLAAISGSVEMLRSGESAAEDSGRLMGIVLREIDRLDALIADFLQFARPAAPKLEAGPARAALLDDVARMAENSLPPASGSSARAMPAPSRSRTRRSCGRCSGTWCATRSRPSKGRAWCGSGDPRGRSASRRWQRRPKRRAEGPGSVEIVVADTGRGIAPADLERIFDPFFTTKPDGTGLGLATVHRIVESHGGTLEVESAARRGHVLPRAACRQRSRHA